MKFRFSSKAKLDIDSIWLYTFNNWSLEQADKYYSEIMAEIERISEHSQIGRTFSRDEKVYKYRQVGAHLVFYKVITKSEIEVIRILHKRMDIENRLQE